jgi:hypothetical protein
MGHAGTEQAYRPRATGWTIFTLLGVAGWLGVTVYVAATNDNPSDATPILRTFAVAGGAFFGVVLVAAAVQLRGSTSRVSEQLYRRLAVFAVSPQTVRAARRQGLRTGHTYLAFAGLTTGLLMTVIGLGEQGPYEILFAVLFLLVLGWFGYGVVALRRAYRSAGDLLAPLGLSMVEAPMMVVGDGNRLVGRVAYRGVRHGREVSIDQTTRTVVTTVAGRCPRRSVTSAATMAAMTGQPVRAWRGVTARAGDDGVTVRRAGNGAGRWFLYDLLLAEHLLDEGHHLR